MLMHVVTILVTLAEGGLLAWHYRDYIGGFIDYWKHWKGDE